MIKNFKQFLNESILTHLTGPTKEELDELLKSKSGYELLLTAAKVNAVDIVEKFINNEDNEIFEQYGERAIINSISTYNLNLIKLLYNKYCENFDKEDLDGYVFIAHSIHQENYESFLFFNNEYNLTDEDLDEILVLMFDDENRTQNGAFDIYYKFLIDKYQLYYISDLLSFIETGNFEIIKYILSYKKIDIDELLNDGFVLDKDLYDILIDYKNNNR